MKRTLCRFCAAITLALSLLAWWGCQPREESVSFFAMGSLCTIRGEGALDKTALQDMASAIDAIFSFTDSHSELVSVNQNQKTTLSAPMQTLVELSLDVQSKTDGAFSPTLGTLTALWDIPGGNTVVPAESAVQNARIHTSGITLDGNILYKTDSETLLDLGAVVKGYAAQTLRDALLQRGITDGMVDIGGTIAVCGSSPHNRETGKAGWSIGIRHPRNLDSTIGTVLVKDAIVSVSGDYERYFEADGIRYHHIFDAATGYPAQTDLCSVAVICRDGALADALSTALFVMGKQKALSFYESAVYDFEMLLIEQDGTVTASEGLAFTPAAS